MNAWSKQAKYDMEAPKYCRRILDERLDLYRAGYTEFQPDTLSFLFLLQAWAVRGNVHAAKQAESILQEMWRLQMEHSDLYISPNGNCYHTVMQAWVEASCPPTRENLHSARTVLWEMWNRFGWGAKWLAPKTEQYELILSAWYKSNHTNAKEEMQNILVEMRQRKEQYPHLILEIPKILLDHQHHHHNDNDEPVEKMENKKHPFMP